MPAYLLTVGATAVSTLVLVACGGLGSTGVDSWVEDYEKQFEGRDVDVKSCSRIGEAIRYNAAPVDLEASLDEVWKCAVKLRAGGSEFVAKCYRVVNEAVPNGIPCSAVGRGCPPGGRREPKTVFLGEVTDQDLKLEEELGDEPAHATVRVDVSHQAAEGAKKHCGYLNVRVPIAADVDDLSQQPRARAAKVIEGSSWAQPQYSFSYTSIDD